MMPMTIHNFNSNLSVLYPAADAARHGRVEIKYIHTLQHVSCTTSLPSTHPPSASHPLPSICIAFPGLQEL